MQSDLRNYGSLTFFEQNLDDIPEVPEPTQSIDLPKALGEAEQMLDTGSPEFNEKTETVLSILYAAWLPDSESAEVSYLLGILCQHVECCEIKSPFSDLLQENFE